MSARPAAPRGSLVVVGTGIRAVAQVTQEALASLRAADRVFHCVCDAVTEAWLHELHPRAESLRPLYRPGVERGLIYTAMAERVLDAVRAGDTVCLAFYGHPGVCAQAGHQSIAMARAEGYAASMLPGVSCEDCLYADLGVDPAEAGCQSHEATRFLSRAMAFDARAGLVLWQIGMLGHLDYQASYRPSGLLALIEHLQPAYGAEHEVLLYELPSYAARAALVQRMPLHRLAQAPMNWAMTLYVPPRP